MIDNARLMELALRGLELEKERIEAEIAGLRQQLGIRGNARGKSRPATASNRGQQKGITAAGRKRLSDLMKARWAARAVKKSARR